MFEYFLKTKTTTKTLHLNLFVVRHGIYLFIIIPDEANMAKHWVLKNIINHTKIFALELNNL